MPTRGASDTIAVPGVSAASAARVAGANDRIRIGLIGCGGMGVYDVEIGHNSMIACHLGNLAQRLGRMVKWDVDKEQVIGDPEAQKMLSRAYRAPWALPKVWPPPLYE